MPDWTTGQITQNFLLSVDMRELVELSRSANIPPTHLSSLVTASVSNGLPILAYTVNTAAKAVRSVSRNIPYTSCCRTRSHCNTDCPQAKASGFTVDGTFQEYAVSYVHHVTLIPEGISSEAAASVLCAGVTVYRALKHSGAQHGDWVVLPGAGGGLGHLAVQYARARGLRVVAVDTGEAKKELVMKLGAEVWIDFKETEDMVKAIKEATGGGPHVALITATSTAAYQQAVDYLRPGGRLMAVSLPPKATIDASVYSIVNKVRHRNSVCGEGAHKCTEYHHLWVGCGQPARCSRGYRHRSAQRSQSDLRFEGIIRLKRVRPLIHV
jgi:D-arabinose 1-dehydrogenase-like Zn-dependent alcohol dehydrogenase